MDKIEQRAGGANTPGVMFYIMAGCKNCEGCADEAQVDRLAELKAYSLTSGRGIKIEKEMGAQ